MTIKEMEEKSGISRTNIRFYEGEGLIHPQRRENGYRDYTPEDVRMLMKVRLLRSMDVPLEQVKAVASGERRLMDVLKELEQDLDLRQAHQERARQAARQMQQNETEFEALEPEQYLAALEQDTPVEDAPPRLNLPWRRYWARVLDYSLVALAVDRLLELFPMWSYPRLPLYLLVMLLVEPLVLMLFATTPGKAIFGIRVTDPEGKRLSYGAGVERTWSVLWDGMGMNIPLLGWYFEYKSLQEAEEEITLPWEWESDLTFADNKNWRYLIYAAAYAAMWAARSWMIGG